MPSLENEDENKVSLGEIISESFKGFFKKRTSSEKRKVKKAARKAHKNTNWKSLKPKKGYTRVKIGKNRYILKRQTATQKTTKKTIGRRLGSNKNL